MGWLEDFLGTGNYDKNFTQEEKTDQYDYNYWNANSGYLSKNYFRETVVVNGELSRDSDGNLIVTTQGIGNSTPTLWSATQNVGGRLFDAGENAVSGIWNMGGKQIDTAKKLAQADDAKLYAFNFNKFVGQKAADYALTYWDKPNPKYPDWGGVDCTNFVSQCWAAAGIPISPAWFCETTPYGNEKPIVTPAWVNVEAFATYMVNAGYAYLSDNSNDAKVGDVIQFQNEYGWHHSVIISRIDENGEIYYASHSDPNDYKRLSEVYPGKEQIRFLCVYKPTGAA